MLLPLLGLMLYFGGWFLFTGVALFTSMALLEFYALFWPGYHRWTAKAFGIVIAIVFLAMVEIQHWEAALAVPIIAFWAGNLRFLFAFAREPEKRNYTKQLLFLAGFFYIPGILFLLLLLPVFEVILVLLTVFASDTGAFYTGSIFGKRKLWPSISPKKTWEGSLGGLGFCILVCVGMRFLIPEGAELPLDWAYWLGAGLLLNLGSQFGDFFESALKRSLGVKDSGKIMPGHGGLLDRIDSLLFALPVYMGWKTLYMFFLT